VAEPKAERGTRARRDRAVAGGRAARRLWLCGPGRAERKADAQLLRRPPPRLPPSSRSGARVPPVGGRAAVRPHGAARAGGDQARRAAAAAHRAHHGLERAPVAQLGRLQAVLAASVALDVLVNGRR
jgi:hypothetical protein